MIKVLIVDDSRSQRVLLSRLLSTDRNIQVVGSAEDAYDAREKIKQLKPDVLTLDVEMPRMDGITFLKNLMRLHPLPVVMISTLTATNSPAALEALNSGAIDFVLKRNLASPEDIKLYSREILRAVKQAAQAKIPASNREDPMTKSGPVNAAIDGLKLSNRLPDTAHRIVAIGASTGGPPALQRVLKNFYDPNSSVLIVQHLPEYFSETFAKRLNESSRMIVKLAESGEVVKKGHVYVAPGGRHLLLRKKGAQFICMLSSVGPVNRHRPSVDVLFSSVTQVAAEQCVAVLMTGMGNDGANGMLELHGAGAVTIAQDENSSVVWGMPRAAVELGGADMVLSEADIPRAVVQLISDLGCNATRRTAV